MENYCSEWVTLNDAKASTGSLRKYVHRWQASGDAPGSVCIIHGLGEHGGRYHSLAESFVEHGYNVFAFDQQGHGRSPEDRGCITSYESLLDDIQAFLLWLSAETNGAPIVLLGHSMGGNLVLNFGLRDYTQPAGIIASSPMLRAVREPGWLFEQVARTAMLFSPNYRLRSEVIAARLMSDPAEQEALIRDDLFHSQLSLRLAAGLIDSGRWAMVQAERLRTPTLLTHGSVDALTRPDASAEFAKRAFDLCRFVELPGMHHDTFRDLDKSRAIDVFLEFVAQQCGVQRTVDES